MITWEPPLIILGMSFSSEILFMLMASPTYPQILAWSSWQWLPILATRWSKISKLENLEAAETIIERGRKAADIVVLYTDKLLSALHPPVEDIPEIHIDDHPSSRPFSGTDEDYSGLLNSCQIGFKAMLMEMLEGLPVRPQPAPYHTRMELSCTRNIRPMEWLVPPKYCHNLNLAEWFRRAREEYTGSPRYREFNGRRTKPTSQEFPNGR